MLQAGKRDQTQKVGETLDQMAEMQADVLLEITGEKQLLGLLSVRDERRKDAFSLEDVDLLRGLTGQIAVTVENSQLYQQTKERDRLAALGRMAAGLAHDQRRLPQDQRSGASTGGSWSRTYSLPAHNISSPIQRS